MLNYMGDALLDAADPYKLQQGGRKLFERNEDARCFACSTVRELLAMCSMIESQSES
jgi:hypothetical protein